MNAMPSGAPKLLLIDALHLVRRCYEALRHSEVADRAQDATATALTAMSRAIREHAPTHVLVAFDERAPTWRHSLYPAYKANRKPMPEDLLQALGPLERRVREQLGVRWYGQAGFEADDIIASAATQWLCEMPLGSEVVIISTDKDLCSLNDSTVRVRNHFGREWKDAQWVRDTLGIEPGQVLDWLALVGDTADNVPGVNGVGEKTAAAWLRQYQSLERIFEELPRDGKRLHTLLHDQKEQARLSRQLVQLSTDMELPFEWKDLELQHGEATASQARYA